MKKQILIALAVILPSVSFAKVDFKELIQENNQAQQELHQGLRENLKETRQIVLNPKRERIVVVEERGTSYTAPTNKDAMRFEKEKIQHRSSEVKNLNRVASELNSYE